MPTIHRLNPLPTAIRLASLCGVLLACSPGEDSGGEMAEATTPAPAAAAEVTSDGLTAADEGKGTVTIDGVQHDDFRGSCELSRNYGKEDMGDLATMEGLKMMVAIDNVASTPAVEMNFVAYTNLDFTMVVQGQGRQRGTISQLAYESDLAPTGTSQAIAKVAFTGQTEAGVPVVARVVCEIQNQF
jgi:hypothetical protein